MTKAKFRKILVNLHLYFAAVLAPAFILVAITGGLYLLGNKGQITKIPVEAASAQSLDFKAETLDADVRAALSVIDPDYAFEYVKNRGTTLQTRPTSRMHYELKTTPNGVTVTRNEPNLQSRMMELHKGHGPGLYKTYQKVSAVALMAIIFGGVLMGLMMPGLRRKTILASIAGAAVFIYVAFLS